MCHIKTRFVVNTKVLVSAFINMYIYICIYIYMYIFFFVEVLDSGLVIIKVLVLAQNYVCLGTRPGLVITKVLRQHK